MGASATTQKNTTATTAPATTAPATTAPVTPTQASTFPTLLINPTKVQYDALGHDNVFCPVNYIIIETSYTVRLLDPKRLEILQSGGTDPDLGYDDGRFEATPLYIKDKLWGHGQTEYVEIVPPAKKSATLSEQARVLNELTKDFVDGVIAFEAKSFTEVFVLKATLKDLDYCHMFDFDGARMIELSHPVFGPTPVRVAIVTVDAESG